MTAPVRLANVRRTYGHGAAEVTALAGITVDFAAGSFTAVMGPSGSGKSTLLHCAAGLDEPTSGSVTLVGKSLTGLGETELTLLRRARVAFVFQAFNLMPALTVWENVTLPTVLSGRRPDSQWVTRIIDQVGLSGRIRHRPSELSGGQQQRVAVARALASRADVTFADEPTGALDSQTAIEVLRLMREMTRYQQTIVMVTHDPVAASYADEVLFLVDGQIVSRLTAPTVEGVAGRLARLGESAKVNR
ncbi:ABC transporter ATP-binding protein [Kibdelosporangium phytohabitans]|uniref:ABC transporter n=1 Tax=Kibdelosporangium phytohabitans TaxID=860235 RepID=A0A0N7F4Q7_9PSEU|nr:ABC transporter ATP-binding protein [Kibdelosporangium phytohabitans]ALG12103.1 ABC transporter [Kibdelosporangium phytohabitans]MBE1463598.1 putative ABC transport system ATP-binding protein [Kibdelosporangium phytohabitans]